MARGYRFAIVSDRTEPVRWTSRCPLTRALLVTAGSQFRSTIASPAPVYSLSGEGLSVVGSRGW